MRFEWDERKNADNLAKHGVSFDLAQRAFWDQMRIIVKDAEHSELEERYFCIGRVEGGILTVRFTMRDRNIRIIGAGYWRSGKKRYEKENRIQQ